MSLTIPEEFLLLGLPTKGPLPRMQAWTPLEFGLAAAQIIELVRRERIEIRDSSVVVRNPELTGDAALDSTLATIGSSRHQDIPRLLRRFRSRIVQTYAERLQEHGLVTVQNDRLSRMGGSLRISVAQPEAAETIRQRLHDSARKDGPVDERDAVLAGLAEACGCSQSLRLGQEEMSRLMDANASSAVAEAVRDSTRALNGALVAIVAAT